MAKTARKGGSMTQRPAIAEVDVRSVIEARATMVDVAYESILNDVLSGRHRGGDLLQENRLAEGLGLSRTPVREALGRLEGEGLLIRRGRVLMVRRISVKEFLDILQVRLLVEPEAAAIAGRTIDKDLVRRLRTAVATMPTDVTPDAHWAIDDEIHLGVARATENDLLLQLVRDLRRRTRLFDLKKIPERFEPGRQEHLRLLDALIVGDEALAREHMRLHLENAKGGILDHIRSL
jgi:DNA-binding GntR family transcriptional regulator